MSEEIPKSKVKELKRKVKIVLSEKKEQVESLADAEWLPRWKQICNSPEVDWNNPYVKVERTLNNIHVQKILSNQRLPVEQRREQVRRYFPDDETFNLYLTGIQPLDPDETPYTYLETKSYVRHATYTIKQKVVKPFKK